MRNLPIPGGCWAWANEETPTNPAKIQMNFFMIERFTVCRQMCQREGLFGDHSACARNKKSDDDYDSRAHERKRTPSMLVEYVIEPALLSPAPLTQSSRIDNRQADENQHRSQPDAESQNDRQCQPGLSRSNAADHPHDRSPARDDAAGNTQQ